MADNIFRSTSALAPGSTPALPQQESKSFLPMLHGAATDTLARMNTRNAKISSVSGNATMEQGEVKLVIKRFRDLTGALSINTHKLLSVGVASFTARRSGIKLKDGTTEYTVAIPFEDYAVRCGYDLVERETKTEAEATAEKKRLKNTADNARKQIKRDLDILHFSELTWTEKVKGKPQDWLNVPIIGSRGIRKGYIYMTFDPVIAQYLNMLPVTQYPVALLGVDGRNANAYNIGLKLSEYYNMDSNQRAGRADRIGVSTLLACTTLPPIEKVLADNKDWIERIKEPFENALDALTACGLLEDWQYTHAKAIPLSEDEAYTITDYTEFSELYVQFVLRDAPDHAERLEARRKAADKKKARRRKKRTTKD